MNNNDKQSFLVLMTGAGEIYNKEITKSLLAFYFDSLKAHSIESIKNAFSKHSTDPKHGSFFPKPADIVRHLAINPEGVLSVENRAELAWHQVMEKIQRIGSYGSLKLDDKQAIAAIKAVGGWNKVSMATYDQLVWIKKEFLQAYDTYENTPLERLPSSLPGLVELQQHKCQEKKALGSIMQEMEERNNAKALPDNSKGDL